MLPTPLELVEADLNDEDSWKEAVKDCSYVYHVASPFPSNVPRDENEIIRPAVDGTLNVLKAVVEAKSRAAGSTDELNCGHNRYE